MKILIPIFILFGVMGLIVIDGRSKGAGQEPTYATRDQIPSIVSKLQRTGRDGSLVVFMFSIPGKRDETLLKLQYSIEKGRLGLDWVLLAPRNIDETRLRDFIERLGYTISKHETNGVSYLRVEGKALGDLGTKILRDFYHLAPKAKLELIVKGFDMKG